MPNWNGCFGDAGWGMGFGGPVMMVLFWVLLIIGGVFLFRWLAGQSRGGKTALHILQERYARGEINKDEFDTLKRDLA